MPGKPTSQEPSPSASGALPRSTEHARPDTEESERPPELFLEIDGKLVPEGDLLPTQPIQTIRDLK